MTTLYRFYDHADALLYIGIAGNPARRFEQHAKHKPWWPTVTRISVNHYPDRPAALDAERHAIRTEHPTHNIRHNHPGPPRLTWTCEHCQGHIDDNDGYFDLYRDDTWHLTHRRCDPSPNSTRYWIPVEDVRTAKDLKDWRAHLKLKNWFVSEDWDRITTSSPVGDRSTHAPNLTSQKRDELERLLFDTDEEQADTQ